jgi:hypothetical protein
MSISARASTALSSLLSTTQNTPSGQGQFQQVQSEFQQLGQDLQTGNLAQAGQDYATLSQNFATAQSGTTAAAPPAAVTTTAAPTLNSNPIAQAFDALSTDLQNGNITATQQDFATIQQDSQQQQGSSQVHHHHHYGGGGGGGQQGNQVSQAVDSLSSALQSGNLSSAQTAFATLQQDLQQFTAGSSSGTTSGSTTASTSSQTNGSNLNVTV